MSRFMRHPAMDVLLETISKDLRKMLVLSSFSFVAGLALQLLAFRMNIFVTVLGIILMIMGVLLFVQWSKVGIAENAPIIRFLQHNPDAIVWVYTAQTQVMPFGVVLFSRTYLVFKLVSGREESMVIPKNKALLLCNWLQRLLPKASFGFSNEKAVLYQDNPRNLIRSHNKGGERSTF